MPTSTFPDTIETQIVESNLVLLEADALISTHISGGIKIIEAEDIQEVRSVTTRSLWIFVADGVEVPDQTGHGNLLVTRLQYNLIYPFRKPTMDGANTRLKFFEYLKRLVYNAAFDNEFSETGTGKNLTTGVALFEREDPAEIVGGKEGKRMILARVFISFNSHVNALTGKVL